jgi:hypothetical protein
MHAGLGYTSQLIFWLAWQPFFLIKKMFTPFLLLRYSEPKKMTWYAGKREEAASSSDQVA